MSSAILFDLEGTIIESGYQKDPSLLETLHINTKNILIEFGIPQNILKNYKKSIYLRNIAYNWLLKRGDFEEYNKLRKAIEQFMNYYDTTSAINSSLYPDTVDILEYLKNNNHILAIITNTSKVATEIILSNLKIKNFFNLIVTRNDVTYIKPNPEMIIYAINKLDSNDNWVIGDSKVDIIAAKKANVKSIIIKRTDNIQNYESDYIIHNLSELKKIF